jgi:hypothetical protein
MGSAFLRDCFNNARALNPDRVMNTRVIYEFKLEFSVVIESNDLQDFTNLLFDGNLILSG